MMNEFIYKTRVYFEDTDANSMVYHSNYLNYFERARTEWLNHIGVDVASLADEGVFFAVVCANINYKRPARLNDLLDVYARVGEFGVTSVTYAQKVTRRDNPGELFCEGEVKIVCINENMRPIAFPETIKGRLV